MAEECLRESISLQADHLPSLLALSCLLLHNGLVTDSAFFEDAEVYIHAAKDVCPENSTVWAILSVIMEGTSCVKSIRPSHRNSAQIPGWNGEFSCRRYPLQPRHWRTNGYWEEMGLAFKSFNQDCLFKSGLCCADTEREHGADEVIHAHHEVKRLVEIAIESGVSAAQANGYLAAAQLMLTMALSACAETTMKHVQSENNSVIINPTLTGF